MTLTPQQISRLEDAIVDYDFPRVFFDFQSGREVRASSMADVEDAICQLLRSAVTEDVRDGLANVIYWGYAQIGYRDRRVRRFRAEITTEHLGRLQALLVGGGPVSLVTLARLRLPEFSGISFISKVLAFLDPGRYCVLDKQLLKLAATPGSRALHRVVVRTQIPVTAKNEVAYDAWRAECAGLSKQYFSDRYRVVDVERGFFQLVQSNQLALAQRIYADI